MPETKDFDKARELYWQGYKLREIETKLAIPYATLYSRKRSEKWDDASVATKVGACLEARMIQLIAKEDKTIFDLQEQETILKCLERQARIKKYENGGNETDLSPAIKKRNEGKKRSHKKGNHLDEEQTEALLKAFKKGLFGYQKNWYDNIHQRIRNILKSRQIGATWYFAREAMCDAATNGNNQIFLSASKAQAHVFREYIVQFVFDATGVQLTGDPITLSNGATLYFLGTNSKTAQSYHGNLYFDEYFWVHKFKELRKVASGMAMHSKWRQTYISTPSTLAHEAYPFWTGEQFNKGRKKADRIEIDLSHARLSSGHVGADGQWRNIVTIEDAVKGGCDLFDLAALKLEYNDEEYKNLLMCQFIDDGDAVFKFSELQQCMVDSWETWDDFSPFAARPLGDKPVWVGYDPSRTRDNASLVVIAPPMVAGGKFRIIERHSWNNMDFDSQAKKIHALTKAYNVQHLAIDVSGIGWGVYELVKAFYPGVKKLIYSVELKTKMVLKAKQLISHRRLEFDRGWNEIAMAFMTIHRAATSTGRQITYQATRTNETGHADLAWATMHALLNEPLQNIESTGGGRRFRIVRC